MGKYESNQKKSGLAVKAALAAAAVLLLVAVAVWLISLAGESRVPVIQPSEETTQTEPAETLPTTEPTQATEPRDLELGQGLRIVSINSYAGIYMEDGSDETVVDVMMLILENGSGQDLQLARIDLQYPDFTAEFEVTNLPQGEKVVLLEKNRHAAVAEAPVSATARNVVFFSEPMSLREEKVEITGANGVLDVKNISGGAIAGPVYIYYKNSASDLLYGGITYRVELKNGLAEGETIRTITGHYTPAGSRVIMVTIGE